MSAAQTKPLWTESPEVQKHGLKVLLFRWKIYRITKNGIVFVSVLKSAYCQLILRKTAESLALKVHSFN